MSEILLLNKFEKEKRVIELYLQDKTIREIAKEVHMSFRDISNIIKRYNRKIRAQQNKNKEDNNQNGQIKKISLSSQAFKLFKEGKKPIDVKCELDIPFEKIRKFWSQYLKLTRMYECYEFYKLFAHEMPSLLSIANFIKRNNVSGKDIANVLRTANDVINLNKIISSLKTEIERLEQIKNNYSLNQKTNYQPLLPLGLPKYCYEQYWE